MGVLPQSTISGGAQDTTVDSFAAALLSRSQATSRAPRPAVLAVALRQDITQLAQSRAASPTGSSITLELELWRADMLTGVVEVDALGRIRQSAEHPLCPTGWYLPLSPPPTPAPPGSCVCYCWAWVQQAAA